MFLSRICIERNLFLISCGQQQLVVRVLLDSMTFRAEMITRLEGLASHTSVLSLARLALDASLTSCHFVNVSWQPEPTSKIDIRTCKWMELRLWIFDPHTPKVWLITQFSFGHDVIWYQQHSWLKSARNPLRRMCFKMRFTTPQRLSVSSRSTE